jgi:hypothetical protein
MIDISLMTMIGQGLGKLPRQVELFIKLVKRQSSRVTGNLPGGGLYHNGLGWCPIEGDLKIKIGIHGVPPYVVCGAFCTTP